jgi:hypothetical protein
MSFSRINQLKYPKEFRISPMEMPFEALKQLEEIVKNLKLTETPSVNSQVDPIVNKEFLAEVSVGAWRLKKKMTDTKTKEPLSEMSKAYRHLESVLLTLKKEGIEIQDHDGDDFDPGQSLKVLAYQPLPNITKEYVYDTIKPSVYLKEERILMGEVIVATYQKSLVSG